MKDILTTTDVIRITGFSRTVIINCVNKELLKCYFVPGSKHRRFIRKDVDQFMKLQGIPEGARLK